MPDIPLRPQVATEFSNGGLGYYQIDSSTPDPAGVSVGFDPLIAAEVRGAQRLLLALESRDQRIRELEYRLTVLSAAARDVVDEQNAASYCDTCSMPTSEHDPDCSIDVLADLAVHSPVHSEA